MNGFEWLESLSQKMKEQAASGAAPEKVQLTVRDFMSKFNYNRRSHLIKRQILNKLDELNLKTVPPFHFYTVGFDDAISIELDWNVRFDGGPSVETDREDGVSDDGQDPTIRIKILDAANRKPDSVNPNDTLSAAVTKMQLRDFSQLPVMQGEREVKGVVSWKSISAARASRGRDCEFVRQCMATATIIDIDTPLLDAADVIQRDGYVLVRDKTNKIAGIVTASDIAEQLTLLSAPFLLVGEIEGRLRRLIIHGKLSLEELRNSSPNSEIAKSINGPADLTFGNYIQLFGKDEIWELIGPSGIDRKEFLNHLKSVGKIRNEVMHFDPEGLDPEQKKSLEDFANFFRYLESIGAV